MKKALLLMTHEGSNYQDLCNLLTKDSNIDLCQTNIVYNHPESFVSLFKFPHKSDNTISVYLDVIKDNYRISIKEISKFNDMCKFIYLITDVEKKMRLQGMLECAKQTHGVLISRNTKNLNFVMKYLNSKENPENLSFSGLKNSDYDFCVKKFSNFLIIE